jgi:hypothetical protein
MLIPSDCTLLATLSPGFSSVEIFPFEPSSTEVFSSEGGFRFVPDAIDEKALMTEDNKLVLGVLDASGPGVAGEVDISGRV